MRYKKIKERLLDEISAMAPDTRLPSRPTLCEMLGTTRTTLDRAVAELVGEGVLYSKDGSGTYVLGCASSGTPTGGIANWGIVVPNVMEGIYSGIIRGVTNIAESLGYNVFLCNSDGDSQKQDEYFKRLIMSNTSGFIVVPTITRNADDAYRSFERLTSNGVPFVFCNRSADGINAPLVTSNDFYGGYIATKHLLAQGYRNIAFLSRIRYKTSVNRCQGYMAALSEANVQINRRLIVIEEDDFSSPDGYKSACRLLDCREADAFFCFNDLIAIGVEKAVRERGLSLSEDIGLIGYDNSELCETASPKITSIAYQSTQIGEKAAEILDKMIKKQYNDKLGLYLFHPEIIVRESCLGPRRNRT